MNTTKLTVEIEIQTQFGPADAIQMIGNLTNATSVPAIKSVNVIKMETDYDFSEALPENVNLKTMQSIPKKIR